jgi:phosphoglycerol transferase MdoB-like AlkP superfamily enzyme
MQKGIIPKLIVSVMIGAKYEAIKPLMVSLFTYFSIAFLIGFNISIARAGVSKIRETTTSKKKRITLLMVALNLLFFRLTQMRSLSRYAFLTTN